MKATICDFCKKAIDQEGIFLWIKSPEFQPNDMCIDCFTGSVNLSEMRRMRRGKVKSKGGRPRKVRGQGSSRPQVDLLPDSTGVYVSPDLDAPKDPLVLSDQTKSVIRRRAAQRGIQPPEQPAA